MKRHGIWLGIAVFFAVHLSAAASAQPPRQDTEPVLLETIARALSDIEKSDNWTAVPSNPSLLKAIGLYLQLVDRTHPGMDSDNMSAGFARLWPADAQPLVIFRRIERGFYCIAIGRAAAAGPSNLYIFDAGTPWLVATGTGGMLRAEGFRYSGRELCLVVCKTPGAPRPVRDVYLLSRKGSGWRPAWTSEREQEWIADTHVKPLRDDWSALRVEGTTHGIRTLDDPKFERQVKSEPIRFYTAIWDRKGDGFIRRTNLSAAAAIRDKLGEMEKSVMFSE